MTAVASQSNELLGYYRPYPEYRDSGIEGVHAVPTHWRDQPLKYVATVNADKLADTTDPDYELAYVDIGNVSLIDGVTSTECYRFETAPSRARRRVQPGDTIISTVRTYLKAVARIDHPPDNLVVSTGFAVLHAGPELAPAYLYRLVQSDAFVERVVAHSVGVSYPAINASDLVRLPIPIPTLDEQRAIAAFLDRETARIDELIAKKQRLIELLAEKRTALISHAVTGQLVVCGDARWQTMHLGRAIKLQRGFDITGASHFDGSVPVISSGGFSGYCNTPIVRGPGVIVGRKGTLGTVHFVETDYWPHDTTLWVKEFRSNHPRFVYYFLVHMKLERFDVGAANPTVNRNHVHPVLVSWPDVPSQHVISRFLDDETEKLANLGGKIEAAVNTLREYRSALISAAVTGKIDVRKGGGR